MRYVVLVCYCFTFFIMSSSDAAQTRLSEEEQAIVQVVKANHEKTLRLLEQSVDINSGTLHTEGVYQVERLLSDQLLEMGFKTEWVAMPPGVNRAPHLFAQHPGKKGKRILLMGHADTVYEPQKNASTWRRMGNHAYGQGVLDMKGGNAIIIAALRALYETGMLADTSISVYVTSDEEFAGTPIEQTRAKLIEIAQKSDVALSFEPMGYTKENQEALTTARRGIARLTLTTSSESGHAAYIFHSLGYSAINEISRILDQFRLQLIEPYLTFNVGTLLGGTDVIYDRDKKEGTASGKQNVIPSKAIAMGEVRYLTREQREQTYQRMIHIVKNPLPQTQGTLTLEETHPPMPPSPGNIALLELYSQVSMDAGWGPVVSLLPEERGAGDIQFVAPFIDCLDGLGVNGGGAHSEKEYIMVDSIERATIRAALMLYRLSRENDGDKKRMGLEP